ncbi:protein ACCELERATED CELL DEATH 6-like [Vitis riparia]|uniref:protein ACCELERATED CELL DEATH 6-like n=1 Tax=Vitis riparia TaxID=96939 RepID=UPI00155A4DFE|nr:protein ACCELERATED CELL DEATH 6-like [Vitis riparia]
MAEERDPVELGMALGADSNMKEDSVTAKKRAKRLAITAEASSEREKGTLDQDEDDLCVGERLGFSDQSNRAKERDLVDQLGMALGADSNMKKDKVTSKKWRADSTLISSDSTMEENPVPPEVWVPETSPIFADNKMEIDISSYLKMEGYRGPPWVREARLARKPISANENKEIDRAMEIDISSYVTMEKYRVPPHMPIFPDANMEIDSETHVEDEDAEHKKLMDRRMHAQATQGNVDGFIKILGSISSEQDLQHSEILCQVSPRKNTCLHIAANFGHHDLAKYIVKECPDLIKNKNSKGDTALHIAARKRNLSFVKIVMDSCPSGSGASQDVEKAEPSLLGIGNKEGNTVLHEALINRCKQEDVVEILIKADPQVAYYPNEEGKSPLYLAAESHYFHVVEAIGNSEVEERMKNRDRKAVHGAIMGKNKEMLEKILAMKLVHQKDKDGRTPLHCAASIGYLEGVQMLLDQSNLDPYQTDSDGFCPIHVASMRGNVDIVKKLLQVSSDSIELLSKRGENILHVAAKYGKDNVVNFVLKEERLENFINEKDNVGNTPLHLATMHGHPKVVSSLTWDKRVDVNLVNDGGQTALDIVLSVKHPTTFHQALIWTALKSAGARPAGNSKFPPSRRCRRCRQDSESPNTDKYKDRVNTLLLVSTLVATVTFAAGFTMPGGYNSSDPNVGMAALLMRNMFHMFVICNTTGMYTSILAAIILIWAQLGDLNLMDTALRFALPLLGLALTAMSLGFMAGVYLVVSNLHWLAIVVVIIGIICLVGLLVSFFLLFLPNKSTNRILRHISYYPFLILVWASKSPEMKRED